MKTCIEINEMMTDLMQQIEDLNAIKVGLFCKLGKDFREDFEISEKIRVIDDELLQKHSTLIAMISSERDFSQEFQSFIRFNKITYDEMIENLMCVKKAISDVSEGILLGQNNITDIDKVENKMFPVYKLIVGLLISSIELEAENDNRAS